MGIKALTIHGRTRCQMYKGEADWSLIAKVKNNPRINIPIFGNGDIDSPQKALEYKNRFGIDGIMIGRAAIGYPGSSGKSVISSTPAKNCRLPQLLNGYRFASNTGQIAPMARRPGGYLFHAPALPHLS